MKGITTIAALPGSGSGCQSALPAEVGRSRETEAGPDMFAPGNITILLSRKDFIEFTPVSSVAPAVPIAGSSPPVVVSNTRDLVAALAQYGHAYTQNKALAAKAMLVGNRVAEMIVCGIGGTWCIERPLDAAGGGE